MRKAAIWEGRAVSFAPNQWMSFGMLRCCMNSAVDRSRLEFHASKLHAKPLGRRQDSADKTQNDKMQDAASPEHSLPHNVLDVVEAFEELREGHERRRGVLPARLLLALLEECNPDPQEVIVRITWESRAPALMMTACRAA